MRVDAWTNFGTGGDSGRLGLLLRSKRATLLAHGSRALLAAAKGRLAAQGAGLAKSRLEALGKGLSLGGPRGPKNASSQKTAGWVFSTWFLRRTSTSRALAMKLLTLFFAPGTRRRAAVAAREERYPDEETRRGGEEETGLTAQRAKGRGQRAKIRQRNRIVRFGHRSLRERNRIIRFGCGSLR